MSDNYIWKCDHCGLYCEIKAKRDPNEFISCIVNDQYQFNKIGGECTVKPELDLMTFFEAWEKAKDGDKVQAESEKGVDWVTKNGPDLHKTIFSIECLMKKQWQIIPAEPVVLSAEEIVDSKHKKYGDKWEDENIYDFAVFCAKDGIENGQIKERKNLQPLIDWAEAHYAEIPSKDLLSILRKINLLPGN